jgi:y4mF family transcriptional regulator
MDNNRRTVEQLRQEIGPVAWFVRQHRKKLGYTQEEFASRVGVGLRFLKDLELGKKSVQLDKVNQVLNYLGHRLIPAPLDPTSSQERN